MDKIKYHQNGLGNEYGDDHTLTDNWNPYLDYGNEYVRVYFRIDTPSYDYQTGFKNNTDRVNWHTEISKLLSSLGITEDCGYGVEKSNDKREYLYAHPQNISGEVKKSNVKKIAETLSDMIMSKLRWVDLYETVYNITDEEYEGFLVGKTLEAKKHIFVKAATKRTTKYYGVYDIARAVAPLIRLTRLGIKDGVNYGTGQTIEFILKIIDTMIDEGYLISATDNGTKYIRSLNKTEQRQYKKTIA